MDLIRGQLIERYLDIQPLSLALHLEVVHPLLLDGQRVDRQRARRRRDRAGFVGAIDREGQRIAVLAEDADVAAEADVSVVVPIVIVSVKLPLA